MTPSYCNDNCGPEACPQCPRPQLLPGNEVAVAAYGSVATQWRVAPSGLRVGLDYGACLPVLQLRLQQWAEAGALPVGEDGMAAGDLLDDVQMIEFGVLSAQSELMDREREAARERREGAH